MINNELMQIVQCSRCGSNKWRFGSNEMACESCNNTLEIFEDIILYTPDSRLVEKPEHVIRDKQANGYLQHCKFGSHRESLSTFISLLPEFAKQRPILDLGCGPGPSTEILQDYGFEKLVSIDFSTQSLLLNKSQLDIIHPKFVRADLNEVSFVEKSVSVVLMTDFLQHLGDWDVQYSFMQKTLRALIPGGRFYLSCFNINIKNYLKGDIHGSFSNGNIRYSRLHHKELCQLIPEGFVVDAIKPMNISMNSRVDKLLCKLPLASFLGRWSVVTGFRVPE
ncbi:class I SAM-dependent methyltransferase [Mariprofundus sp. KV]|uniref:class I SAM-dependent methyltransferase n=1 Tax=Mariprofundus sp. KV TaxID=2608715 RepID=UPI0015A2C4F5|nr:class I SAM-dependent methyltransferase [Mariprofundus sp. KV]